MPTVILAPSLARWLTASPGQSVGEVRIDLPGNTIREVLNSLFDVHPNLRGYVVDETSAIRHHVVVYLDDSAVDKSQCDVPIPSDGELFLFQALSGG